MSDFVYSLNLDAAFKSPARDENKRFRDLAALVSQRLQRIATNLEERGFFFEASEGDRLAMKFDDFAYSDGGCFEFSRLWEELTDWGETLVTVGRREKSLCAIPALPHQFCC